MDTVTSNQLGKITNAQFEKLQTQIMQVILENEIQEILQEGELTENIDTLNITCSKLPYQITYRDKEKTDKSEPEHKCSNLFRTEPIDISKAIILDSKPPILAVKTLELLELSSTIISLTTEEKDEINNSNTLSKAIFKSKFNTIAVEVAEGETQRDSAKGTKSIKLNFLKIPETWSDKSFKKHSKDTK
ncbi:hypothetical protein G9A89_017510 [Geosiphon pyriformis]|nr:hypothetical protein G9A89_017510 [Geosiphon pyriformis]